MKVDIQIISTPSAQTAASVGLNFANCSYLINCGESTQRLMGQSRFRLSKLKCIFATNISWDSVGGIPGLLLSVSEIEPKLQDLRLLGPKNLTSFLSGSSIFVRRPDMPLSLTEISDSKIVYSDENLSVQAAVVYPDGELLVDNDIQLPTKVKRPKILQEMFKIANDDRAASVGEALFPPSAVSLIFNLPPVPGKMDGKKANELGVSGKDRKKLIVGESVISTMGTVVTPEMCVEPQRPGQTIVYADCNRICYLGNFLGNDLMKSVIDGAKLSKTTVIHSCSADVARNEDYVNWIKSFPDNSRHILLCNGFHSTNDVFYSSDDLVHVLSEISDLFRVIKHEDEFEGDGLSLTELQNCSLGSHKISIQLEPKPALYETFKSKLDLTRCEEFENMVTELQQAISHTSECAAADEVQYIISLGTGSCMPGKLRNVSSTLVRLSSGIILFDAGEGTLAQIHRSYTDSTAAEFFELLKTVFISHLHADHCLGTFNILKRWLIYHKSDSSKLLVICPHLFAEWAQEFARIEGIHLNRINFIDSKSLTESADEIDQLAIVDAGLKIARTVPVTHSKYSYGITVTDNNGFKVTYSGDCRPSANLVLEGLESDLLIHEATFGDDKFEEALNKNHSTIGEAIQVAKDMKAKNLLLTHFSQRYPVIPPDCMLDHEYGPCIGFAFDLMRVQMKDYWKWKHLAKAFQSNIIQE